MTENEAIKELKYIKRRCDNEGRYKDCDALEKAIKALEEIQQYRVYIEIFENHFCKEALELLSDKEEFRKWLERGKWIAKKCDEINRKLESFEAIGTIEEFKALKEKSVEKKPHSISIANDIGNSMVECPICHARSDYDVKSIKRGYCWKCGQKLDWSE